MNAISELQEVISIDVKVGYESREEIIANAVDFLLGDYNPDWLEEEATRLTDAMLAKHFEEQKTWTDETDCDRLDEAFAELDRHGIVARQNFTCCQIKTYHAAEHKGQNGRYHARNRFVEKVFGCVSTHSGTAFRFYLFHLAQ